MQEQWERNTWKTTRKARCDRETFEQRLLSHKRGKSFGWRSEVIVILEVKMKHWWCPFTLGFYSISLTTIQQGIASNTVISTDIKYRKTLFARNKKPISRPYQESHFEYLVCLVKERPHVSKCRPKWERSSSRNCEIKCPWKEKENLLWGMCSSRLDSQKESQARRSEDSTLFWDSNWVCKNIFKSKVIKRFVLHCPTQLWQHKATSQETHDD